MEGVYIGTCFLPTQKKNALAEGISEHKRDQQIQCLILFDVLQSQISQVGVRSGARFSRTSLGGGWGLGFAGCSIYMWIRMMGEDGMVGGAIGDRKMVILILEV